MSIIILDFGSQYTNLIAKRLRSLGIETIVSDHSKTLSEILRLHSLKGSKCQPIKGIILSGGPQSVGTATITFDHQILQQRQIPCLGICFGFHLIAKFYGCTIGQGDQGFYGRHYITFNQPLFNVGSETGMVWMSCGDTIQTVSDAINVVAVTREGVPAIFNVKEMPQYGIQFHPEVNDTDMGIEYLAKFAGDICGLQINRQVSSDRKAAILEDVRDKVGNITDFCIVSLVSGGVDSTVATVLCQEAFQAPDVVYPFYIDSGLMRYGETEEIQKNLRELFPNLSVVRREQQFFDVLKNLEAPEDKRKAISKKFVDIAIEIIGSLETKYKHVFLCQGTLYTDLIESGKNSNMAHMIKSHHNVNNPILEAKRASGLLIEPNRMMYKDDVRELGLQLGISRDLLYRHPFPGPGLAIRITGEVTKERVEILQLADKIFIDELKNAGIYDDIWQAFATLILARTVAVQGDGRNEGKYMVNLRAINSVDGMTATPSRIDLGLLEHIGTVIMDRLRSVTRVVYDVTSKPPGTIELQ